MKRFALLCLLAPLVSLTAFAEVRFGDLDLNDSNQILFSATTSSPGYGEFKTLFRADAESKSVEQLTVFPEFMYFVQGGSALQIQNRYGVFRSNRSFSSVSPLGDFPGFTAGDQVQEGLLNPAQSSPDGNYILFLEASSYGFGDLVLYDVAQDKRYVVSTGLELKMGGGFAQWSPDSRFFIFGKGGRIYYYSLDQLEGDEVIVEEYRSLGEGHMSSVRWTKDNSLYYIQGRLVYEVLSQEFFTRSLYTELLKVGTIVGKIPFEYDPNFDRFWISPDGAKILLDKGGQNVFLYFLQAEDFLSTGETRSLPYLYLPRSSRIDQVAWSITDVITVLTSHQQDGERVSGVYRLKLDLNAPALSFQKQSDTGVVDIILSPDGTKAAELTGDGVTIRNYTTWREETSFKHPEPLHATWRDSSEIAVAGRWKIELVNVNDGSARTIALSQVEKASFSDQGPVAEVNGTTYLYDGSSWKASSEAALRERKQANETFRLYTESNPTGAYRNMVMVRRVRLPGTYNLFPFPQKRYEPFPLYDETVDFSRFNHGSRIRRREVSLVFNAIDTAEGLNEILSVLDIYDIKATFFVNGEFIRRHPDAVKEIAQSGHEVGSLFYVYFNMTDVRFTMDKNFIKEGLARNENDYYEATGKELSLVWHAPYYFVSSDIVAASREMNYVYVGRDLDTLDWVPDTDTNRSKGLYMSSANLIERLMELKKPGSIIPIRIGRAPGGREDYLFHRIDVLVNALIDEGYDIVPVSSLIEHAR